MEPGKFGPYLRDLRTRRGLTQEQVAEALRVSGAAVSKWENGKCLPDLTKLEALAEVLGVGILDLMRCGAAPAPRLAPENAGPDPAAQSWRHQARGAAVLLIFTALVIFLQYFPLHRVVQVWQPSWYETGEISQLAYMGSREEWQTAQPVLELAEQAFSDLSLTEAEAAVRYGELRRYCFPRDRYPEVIREEHDLDLWSAHFSGGSGQMWVCYSQEGYDAAGKCTTGSWRVPSLWYLERALDGTWEVIYIKEHP